MSLFVDTVGVCFLMSFVLSVFVAVFVLLDSHVFLGGGDQQTANCKIIKNQQPTTQISLKLRPPLYCPWGDPGVSIGSASGSPTSLSRISLRQGAVKTHGGSCSEAGGQAWSKTGIDLSQFLLIECLSFDRSTRHHVVEIPFPAETAGFGFY